MENALANKDIMKILKVNVLKTIILMSMIYVLTFVYNNSNKEYIYLKICIIIIKLLFEFYIFL